MVFLFLGILIQIIKLIFPGYPADIFTVSGAYHRRFGMGISVCLGHHLRPVDISRGWAVRAGGMVFVTMQFLRQPSSLTNRIFPHLLSPVLKYRTKAAAKVGSLGRQPAVIHSRGIKIHQLCQRIRHSRVRRFPFRRFYQKRHSGQTVLHTALGFFRDSVISCKISMVA